MKNPEERAKVAMEIQLADAAVNMIGLDGELAERLPIEDQEPRAEWAERLAHMKAVLENRIEEYRRDYGDDLKVMSRDGDEETMKFMREVTGAMHAYRKNKH